MDADVARFLRHLEHERRLSPRTVVSYGKDLRDLCQFLDEHRGGGEWSWHSVERLDLRSFMGWCGRKGLTRRTVARKLSAIRTFYRFLHLEDRVPSDPARTLRSPRIEKRLPGHATSRNIEAVFSRAEVRAAENTFRGTRNLVILELLYGSGLRLSELHGLDLSDLELGQEQAKVLGKGSKERLVPITGAARRAIVHYLSRGGQIYIRVFPDKAVSSRPAETRMGGGKGAVDRWVAGVKPGRILFEVSGIGQEMAHEALRLASQKLPVSTTMISRGDGQQASE